jgi:citrate lyase subunit beta/citryl-CoA lyase
MQSSPPLDCIPLLPNLAPCEHIAGNEKFILKAFSLQEQYITSSGRSLVDITLDLEDGAPVGSEEALRSLFVRLLKGRENRLKQAGARIHPPDSEHCAPDIERLVGEAGGELAYITIPKVRGVRDVLWCAGLIRNAQRRAGRARNIPLHILIETTPALGEIEQIAKLPEVETLDFGLMDFISQLGGAVPATAMRSPDQFSNTLVSTTKTRIALAALSANKIPSHNVTVDFRSPDTVYADALRARRDYGFLRMWSIHPDQIAPIIKALTPSAQEAKEAKEIIELAKAADWGPIEHNGRLHDRASFRYYWGVISRALN